MLKVLLILDFEVIKLFRTASLTNGLARTGDSVLQKGILFR